MPSGWAPWSAGVRPQRTPGPNRARIAPPGGPPGLVGPETFARSEPGNARRHKSAAPALPIDGLAAGRDDDVRELLFEYVALTGNDAGRSGVAAPGELPTVLSMSSRIHGARSHNLAASCSRSSAATPWDVWGSISYRTTPPSSSGSTFGQPLADRGCSCTCLGGRAVGPDTGFAPGRRRCRANPRGSDGLVSADGVPGDGVIPLGAGWPRRDGAASAGALDTNRSSCRSFLSGSRPPGQQPQGATV